MQHSVIMRSRTAALLVLACTACDVLEPHSGRPVISVDITPSAETLTFTPNARRTIALTAAARTIFGASVPSDQLTWTSSDSSVIVTGTGPSATVTWATPESGATTVGAVEITATDGTVTGRLTIVACPVRQIAAKNSGTLLLGRHSALVSAAYGYNGKTWSPFTAPAHVLSVPVHWTSSDSNVVSLRNDSATASSIGDALLTAEACGATDTVSVRVVNSGYHVTVIAVPGGGTTWPRALNDSGEAVVYATGNPAIHYLWKAGTATPLTGCHALDVNDRSQVLCLGRGPKVWANGTISTLDTIDYSNAWINDAGHVAGRTPLGTPFIWKGPGTFTALSSRIATLVAGLNEVDDVVGSIAHADGDDRKPVLWHDGLTLLQGNLGGPSDGLALNDSSDVAVRSESRTCLGSLGTVPLLRIRNWGLQLRAREFCLNNDVATSAIGINNRHEVIGIGSQGPFIWANGRLTLLNDVVDDRDWSIDSVVDINERGRILGFATNKRTNVTSAVILDPP